MDRRKALLRLYDMLPFERHPFWRAVFTKSLDYSQIINAEVQHWIRTRAGQELRREALEVAQKVSPQIFESLLQTYLEECTKDQSGPSHFELIERLVTHGGKNQTELASAVSTPGNSAAIALYADIGGRGAGCHMLGAGTVEHFYSQLSPKIFEAYVGLYGMTEFQAETYRIHGPMDQEHAERAFAVLDEAVDLHGWNAIEAAVRDAFVATSLHYDGMLQAATGVLSYWDGRES
jgi:pyrroloquinoline quinone (PQQ) biosynthesis protein C